MTCHVRGHVARAAKVRRRQFVAMSWSCLRAAGVSVGGLFASVPTHAHAGWAVSAHGNATLVNDVFIIQQ